MKLSHQLSFVLISSALLTGCSGKSFTLQSYADEYFNDKKPKEAQSTQLVERSTQAHDLQKSETSVSSSYIDDTTTNTAIKRGPGADIAWSSTYKRDKERPEKGAFQKSLDKWTDEEWEPTFEGDKNQTIKDKEANEHFTLQHYVDKVEKYIDKKEQEKEGQAHEPAHYEKINKLPVIGN